MFKSGSQLFTGILIGIVAAALIGKLFLTRQANPQPGLPSAPITQTEKGNTNAPENKNSQVAGIPQKVYDVLAYIRQNHHAMNGYVGGRVFSNREQMLAQTDANGNPLHYQEWDVNPKIEGVNRGTERIITGSDGRAWYTNDHYQSFKEIK